MDKIVFIKQLVEKGGPEEADYPLLTAWLHATAQKWRGGQLSEKDIEDIKEAFGNALSIETMQGFGLCKPHGYAGDYEMIDRIYMHHKSKNPLLKRWDEYFHAQAGPIAVRNRKLYFIKLLKLLERDGNAPANVLNLASGPARDIFEFFNHNENGHLTFDCIDQDEDAIKYASQLNTQFLQNIHFFRANVFKFTPPKRYRLIWSAGLFDYFDDKTFVWMLGRVLQYLEPAGELVIGNFSLENPTRDYMELVGEWFLHHRSPETLMQLAKQCGISEENIYVGKEPKGVNLFLHIKNGEHFLLEQQGSHQRLASA